MNIVELREKRAKLWATMEGFLDTHRNDKGVLSSEDDAVYLGSVIAKIGSSSSSKIGFFAGTPIARQTLSSTTQNMSYSTATSSNYLKILNNLVGILVKYGLIGT